MKRLFLCSLLCLFALSALSALTACARKPASTADVPRLLSQRYQIAVAPFSQPLHAGQLISGQIPEDQGRIAHDELLALDKDLHDVLQRETKRQYNFIPAPTLQNDDFAHASGQPTGLARWLAYGKKHNAQLLLVPQVLNWHEREGSQAGVSSPAHVRLEFFLLNIPESGVEGRSVFEEKQVGLADDLLSVGNFVRRRGQWVTAGQLSREAMLQAVRELGL